MAATEIPDEAPAANVIVALTRVMRDLPGIGKGGRAAQDQGGYAYRGIEQITAHAQALFARHGVVMVPRVTSWTREEVLVGKDKKVWHDEMVEVVYTVYGPGGPMDQIEVGPLRAIGRDGTDKGVNKCMTQALKYALIQTLCIGDKADDNDGTTDLAEREHGPAYTRIDDANADIIRERLTRVCKTLGGYPDRWLQVPLWKIAEVHKIDVADLPIALEILDTAEAAIELSEAGGPGGEAGEGSTDDEARRVATASDGETPAPPAPLSAAQEAAREWVDAWLAKGDRTDDEIRAEAHIARENGDVGLLDVLVDLALERGVDIRPEPALDE